MVLNIPDGGSGSRIHADGPLLPSLSAFASSHNGKFRRPLTDPAAPEEEKRSAEAAPVGLLSFIKSFNVRCGVNGKPKADSKCSCCSGEEREMAAVEEPVMAAPVCSEDEDEGLAEEGMEEDAPEEAVEMDDGPGLLHSEGMEGATPAGGAAAVVAVEAGGAEKLPRARRSARRGGRLALRMMALPIGVACSNDNGGGGGGREG